MQVEPKASGIDFANDLTYSEQVNPYTYKSFYNGGGVGLGDLDNDGFLDVILTGNQVDNGVYRNLGNWQFASVGKASGLTAPGAWTTGVTIADVNGDGLLDVYLCKSGPPGGANRRNELRLNRGDWIFEDVARSAGVDDYGLSVHAAFVDYDRDGDLDLYLLNNSIRSVGGYDLRPGAREVADSMGGNKLYRNDLAESGDLTFTDVTTSSGIYSSDIGFGLGVTVGDVNADGWPDLYVSNDFFERDYLYINSQDGKFVESLAEMAPELSLGAMGADMADLTGDEYPEIFVTEMLPAQVSRYFTKSQFESWTKRQTAEARGYHRQFARNTLLVNQAGKHLGDVARVAGVDATDWSWGALAADLDNDGWRDLYIANGIGRDLLDLDYVNFVANPANIREWMSTGGEVVKRLVDSMPSEPIPNVAYRNLGTGLAFADSTTQWGLNLPSFSNGSAYGDLDNDGDLDLVVNTVNSPPLLYRNRTRERDPDRHYLQLRLVDTSSLGNVYAWGSKVRAYAGTHVWYAEVAPVRGYQSTVDARVHLGLDTVPLLDSLVVYWSSGATSAYPRVTVDREVTLYAPPPGNSVRSRAARELRDRGRESPPAPWRPLAFVHRESPHDDFARYPLLAEMISAEGPALAPSRGRDSIVFLGGGRDQAGQIFRKESDAWRDVTNAVLQEDKRYEDVRATWIDLDDDGLEDLIVGSGGDESAQGELGLRLRAYRHLGGGRLTAYPHLFPRLNGLAIGALTAFDADGDGDQDLFAGTHFSRGSYALQASSAVILNHGRGRWQIGDDDQFAALRGGMVRSSTTCDVDGDGREELAIGRDYGPVTVYRRRDDGRWENLAKGPAGLWRALLAVDIDGDGDDELIAGNMGLNSRLRALDSIPLTLRVGDFDANGTVEHVLTGPIGGREVLLHQMTDLVTRLPGLRKRVHRFKTYAAMSPYALIDTTRAIASLYAKELRSGVLDVQVGSPRLTFTPLPRAAQLTQVRALTRDRTADRRDVRVFAAGNYGYLKPEFGSQLGGVGQIWQFGGGSLTPLVRDFAPTLSGEVRALNTAAGYLFAARNNDTALVYPLRNTHDPS